MLLIAGVYKAQLRDAVGIGAARCWRACNRLNLTTLEASVAV